MWRSVVAVLVAGVAMLLLSAGGDDVAGYRSGSNVWLLGAKVKDTNLQGFHEVEVDNPDVVAFYDSSRTIQFEKQDTAVSAALFAHGGKLCGVVIAVPPSEKPFKYLRKYYAGRMGGCDQTIDEADQCVWSDSAEDYLILIKDATNSGNPMTLIMYVRGEYLLGTSGDTVPGWLRDLFSGD